MDTRVKPEQEAVVGGYALMSLSVIPDLIGNPARRVYGAVGLFACANAQAAGSPGQAG